MVVISYNPEGVEFLMNRFKTVQDGGADDPKQNNMLFSSDVGPLNVVLTLLYS